MGVETSNKFDPFADRVDKLRIIRFSPRLRDNDNLFLAEVVPRVGQGGDPARANAVHVANRLLDFRRPELYAAANQQIFLAPRDEQVVVDQKPQVAGVQPAVLDR